jgi:hypothetical protein
MTRSVVQRAIILGQLKEWRSTVFRLISRRALLRSEIMLICVFSLFACARWVPLSVSSRFDSATLGTVRVTTSDKHTFILDSAAVNQSGVKGKAQTTPSRRVFIPADSISRIERQRGRGAQALNTYWNSLAVVIIICGAIGALATL